LSSQARSGYAEVLRESDALRRAPRQGAGRAPPGDRELDAELAREARLETVVAQALAHNPELLEAQARVRASAERVHSAGRLPDPELKYEQLGVPLDRPHALGDAQMLMLGVSQRFPAPGSLDAQSEVALHEAKMFVQAARARVLALRAQAQQAYFAYARATDERLIQLEAVEIAARVVELARGRYEAGRASQQEVLRAIVELSRLHNQLAAVEPELRASRALLNTLMARPPDAPLGPPAARPPATVMLHADTLERKLLAQRPELASAGRAVQRSAAALEASRSTARWPSFALGADYWLMPQMEQPHAYGAMLSVSLPWLNPQHDEQVREAEHMLAADRRGLEAARNQARYELHEAIARHDAARASFVIIDRDLLEQARRSYDSAQTGFATGQSGASDVLEALRALLEVRLERTRALARLQSAAADVERAIGGALESAPGAPGASP
jgi:outer membrane protein TolC